MFFDSVAKCRCGAKVCQGVLATGLLLVFCSFLAGCKTTPKPYVADFGFSVNVARVNPRWPGDLKNLTPAEREVLEERGRPDYFHLIWSSYETVLDRTQLNKAIRNPGSDNEKERIGWVYLEDKKEITFPSTTKSKEAPLKDKVRVICREGDPVEPKVLPNSRNVRVEKWHYINSGVIYTFEDDTMVKEDRTSVPAMPGFAGR
ncbi:MAG TPA: hypothetical protein PKH31_11215 [Candidatus Sumerlaeota bacterium]|nr:hypothetical protein [Candidatus Sumerlaeota bacterium]